MIGRFLTPELSNQEQLEQLTWLRMFYVLGELLVIAVTQFYLKVEMPWQWLWFIAFAHLISTAGCYVYARYTENVTNELLIGTTVADIVLFSMSLWLSGGVTNGLVSILLIPVATAAALFRWQTSMVLGLIASISFTILLWMYWQAPGSSHHEHMFNNGANSFSLHVFGMWLTFIFSCLLLIWFIGQQAYVVRSKEKKLSELREQRLRDEQLVAIATFAANAAHDLATPLSSISLLCGEVRDEIDDDDLKTSMDTLVDQVELCREIVQTISHKAIQSKSRRYLPVMPGEYFANILERWLVSRPDIEMQCVNELLENDTQQIFIPESGLDAAITNILDNAADASVNNGKNALDVTIKMRDASKLQISIQDYGDGIPDELLEKLGKEPVVSRRSGLGLGQFLANATIERIGGHVWRQNTEQGTSTVITIQL